MFDGSLTSIKILKKLCEDFKMKPGKGFGQNFLINKYVVGRIVKAGGVNENDLVLEIGPGFGALTDELLKYAGKVVSVEKDKRLQDFQIINHAKEINGGKFELIENDVLDVDLRKVLEIKNEKQKIKSYKIISNIPYSITSPILWKFLHYENNKPSEMVLMVQKEVGERIIAKPGKMNILAVMCQFYADCKIIVNVPSKNFWPAPKVDSVVIQLKVKSEKLKVNEKFFMKIVKIGFSAKRKMLKKNLSNTLKITQEKLIEIFKKIDLDEKIRAQNLSVKNWIELVNEIEKNQ